MPSRKQAGFRNGRTLRSSFAQRNEGILVLKNKNASPAEAEEVVYSLGKQNRWMIPEMVKQQTGDGRSRSVFGDDDFVLIEKRSLKRPSKNDVWVCSNGRSCKGSSKNGRIQQETNSIEVVLEVTYPSSKGDQKYSSHVQYKPTKRSKNGHRHRPAIKVEQYPGLCDYELDEDDSDSASYDDDDNLYSKYNPVSLEHFISQSLNLHHKQHNEKVKRDLISFRDVDHDKKVKKSTEVSSMNQEPTNKVVIISDKELADQHKATYDLLKKRHTMLESILFIVFCPHYDPSSLKRISRLGLKRNKLSAFEQEMEGKGSASKDSESQQKIAAFKVSESQQKFVAEYKSSQVKLVSNDIAKSELQRIWGKNYHEGKSCPRKFAINVAQPTSSLESTCILIELGDELDQSTNHCTASIKLLLNNELLKVSEETAQMIVQDFSVTMETSSSALSVKDVINQAKLCTRKHMAAAYGKKDTLSLKKSASLELIERVERCKGTLYTEEEAFREIRKEMDEASKKMEDHFYGCDLCSVRECGICCEELTVTDSTSYTMLKSCGHSFCNACYKMYLHTKLTNGQVDLLCPQYACKVIIDDVTIMSLVPAWYSRYFSRKMQSCLAKSPSWKTCPSEQCQSVMKLTSTRCVNHSKSLPTSTRVQVACSCKNIWCFNCREQTHWPATCQKAKTFRTQNLAYQRGNTTSLITSVSVKNCPSCSYPIEKDRGCSFMYCIMCNTAFCWPCLVVYATEPRHVCRINQRQDLGKRLVELTLLSADAERYAYLAAQNYFAVRAGITVKARQRIKSLERGLQAHQTLKKITTKFCTSKMSSILDSMIENNVVDALRNACDLKLQTQIAVEGLAISGLSSDKNSSYFGECMALLYILEKLTDILENPLALQKALNVKRMNELVELGQMILMRLK